MGFLAVLAWLIRLLLAAVVTCIGGALWALYSYNACTPPAPELCPCVSGEWDPLDARWRRLIAALDDMVNVLCWPTVSAASAAVGHLVAWLFGRRTFRAIFDDAYVAITTANYRDCGCALGGAARLDATSAVGVCPSLAAQSPFRYIRAEALAAVVRPAEPAPAAEPAGQDTATPAD
jgi:hypothetical protein